MEHHFAIAAAAAAAAAAIVATVATVGLDELHALVNDGRERGRSAELDALDDLVVARQQLLHRVDALGVEADLARRSATIRVLVGRQEREAVRRLGARVAEREAVAAEHRLGGARVTVAIDALEQLVDAEAERGDDLLVGIVHALAHRAMHGRCGGESVTSAAPLVARREVDGHDHVDHVRLVDAHARAHSRVHAKRVQCRQLAEQLVASARIVAAYRAGQCGRGGNRLLLLLVDVAVSDGGEASGPHVQGRIVEAGIAAYGRQVDAIQVHVELTESVADSSTRRRCGRRRHRCLYDK